MGRMRRLVALLAVLAVGCGNDIADGPSPAPAPVTVALDFTPNPVHAPLYMAHGLDIRAPGSGPDSLKLVASGKVAVGVLDIHDLAIAREAGTDVVAVGALVGKPLAALLTQPDVRRPRELEGRTVGVSGLPSDPAFVRAIVEHDGGDFDSIRQITIGFNAVSRLLTKRVDGVPAFWNAEGVAVKRRGLDVKEFRVEDYGAPPYPEVVLITSRATLRERPGDVERAVFKIAEGVTAARAQPDVAVRRIAKAAGTTDVALVRAQLDAVLPLFVDGLALDRDVLEQWADFDVEIGLVKERPDIDRAFDFTFAALGP
jgi:NitT/TauT family transport system substrate-binding protein/putative hydroxymethylpyrimidine transport system substrate-binding protein